MIQKTGIFVVVLFVLFCCIPAGASDSDEVDAIPEICTLHHILTSQSIKDWIAQAEREVAATDDYLMKQRSQHEVAIARIKDGEVVYQCKNGQYKSRDNNTGNLCCDQYYNLSYDYDNSTWAIYPINYVDFTRYIKHNVPVTAIKNHWKREMHQLWIDSSYLAGTVFDGKQIDRWGRDYYSDDDKHSIEYNIAPRYNDTNGNTWEITISLQYWPDPDKIEEGCYYRNLGTSRYEISARVVHNKYALVINYDDFVLGPIVYHY